MTHLHVGKKYQNLSSDVEKELSCTRITDYALKKARDFILNYVLVLWCLCDCNMLHLRCNCYDLLHLHLLEFGYEHLHEYDSI